jgi:thiamine biosynthesis lipoprotein
MASPCEVLIDTEDESHASEMIAIAQQEAYRIEQKFSRYRDDNIVYQINNNSDAIKVDEETARLFDFAETCYSISDGLFDITSGILRQAWHFDQSDKLPRQAELEKLLPRIGWEKLSWKNPVFHMPEGMEIDFGGIGKEYAVDATLALLKPQTECSFMINFGGDCHASGPQKNGSAWITGIENPRKPGDATAVIKLKRGALATSGDVYKYLLKNNIRYGHILNPKTGWPSPDSPLSVTVSSATCIEAGILSTLAMLNGVKAEKFLGHQNVKYWCYR